MKEILIAVEDCYIRFNTRHNAKGVELALKSLAYTLKSVEASGQWPQFIILMRHATMTLRDELLAEMNK